MFAKRGEASPVLANMTLDGLEMILRQKYPQTDSLAVQGKNKKVNLVRYADDCAPGNVHMR